MLLCAMLSLTANAIDVTIGDVMYSLDETTTTAELKEVTTDFAGDLVVLDYIDNGGVRYTVTSIGQKAGYYHKGITSVKIPDTMERIGDKAFMNCPNLVGFDLGEGVKEIGEYAFYGCVGPQKLRIPDSVTSIGTSGLGCSGVIDVHTGNGLTEIVETALPRPVNSITIGTNVQRVVRIEATKVYWLPETPPELVERGGTSCNYVKNDQYNISEMVVYPRLDEMFECDGVMYVPTDDGCCDAIDCSYDEQVKRLVIPKTVTNAKTQTELTVKNLRPYAFFRNDYLEEVTLEADVPEVPYWTFARCTSLSKFIITDRENSICIHDEAFTVVGDWENQTPLEYFYIGAQPTGTWGDWEGRISAELQTLVIGDAVSSFKMGFSYANLTTLELGCNLTTLKGSLSEASALTKILCKTSLPPVCEEGMFSNATKASCQLLVPGANIAAYQKAAEWKDISNIADGGFLPNYVLTDNLWYRLDRSNMTAEVYCMDDKQDERNVVIPEQVEEGEQTFTVNAVHESALCNCKASYITIPCTITAIGALAFAQNFKDELLCIICHMEQPVEVEKGAFGWAEKDYQGHLNVSSYASAVLYVPAGTKSLFETADNWNYFKKVDDEHDGEVLVEEIRYMINKSERTADLYAPLRERPRPREITIPATVSDGTTDYVVQSIGDRGLSSSTNFNYDLTCVSLPSSIKRIGSRAFYNDMETKLTVENFPEDLEEIGDYAFYCPIDNVTIPAKVKSIGEHAFMGGKLVTVTSYLEEPFDIDATVFAKMVRRIRTDYPTQNDATLYVPKGTKARYEALEGWSYFAEIKEGLPGDDETAIGTVRQEDDQMTTVYNLQGLRVIQPKHGLYIINGRKVVISGAANK